ncbi:MAG: cytochrome-c peroxidase [Gemmatimonadetes bacterium]|nr:cytochrome-c peroxidase [Gemmatimonadota bacterium]
MADHLLFGIGPELRNPSRREAHHAGVRARRSGRDAKTATWLERRIMAATLILGGLALTACTADEPAAPVARMDLAATAAGELAGTVRQLARARGVTPLARPAPVRPSLVQLGQMLMFDKELSGNRDIACMTCHMPEFGTGDARSLAIGQGASGLGPGRKHPTNAFIPRNAPPLFNLSALMSLFWDGRVSTDASGHLITPAGRQITSRMEAVFEFGPLSALGLFPVLSREEMRAFDGNELAALRDEARPAIWEALMHRLGAIPEYRTLFESAYPGTPFRAMTFAHASNAMAGFMIESFSFTDSPWDRFLRGDNAALDEDQLKGARTFLTIRCSLCHNGPAFTDNQFHNVAVAQFGPGLGDGPGGNDDFGRMRVTGHDSDRYRFRTTPLRNVVLTAPYGHDGAFHGLRDFIEHYSESHLKLRSFDPLGLEPLLQGTLLHNAEDILATRDPILDGVVLPAGIVDQLTMYMATLTDPAAVNLNHVIPDRVPSGLPVDRITTAAAR